jgi:hypothetical protein
MSDLDQALAATEKNVEQGQKALEEYGQRLQQDDRSQIARVIVFFFVGLIALAVVLVAGGTLLKGWAEWKDAAKFFLDLLSSVLLPVVTLVIGYYFGKEQK